MMSVLPSQPYLLTDYQWPEGTATLTYSFAEFNFHGTDP